MVSISSQSFSSSAVWLSGCSAPIDDKNSSARLLEQAAVWFSVLQSVHLTVTTSKHVYHVPTSLASFAEF
ncbi:unnamed protein product [Linum tenue]|uniref:Uncharacterized protein n=1 Tax=Linum tenue TaxID=586396 RepID=A0AAV0SAS9_9ROSI|nr:unnamed protein product [Linum tenue]